MGTTHAVVTIPSDTGLPEDNVINTFTFAGADAIPDVPGELTILLAAFYNIIPANADQSVAHWMAARLNNAAGACSIDLYNVTNDLDGGPAGPPYFSDTWTLAAASSANDMPREVALVTSLVGLGRDDVSPDVPDDADPAGPDPGLERDRPMQRRTGRIYGGPFNVAGLAETGRPLSNLRESYREAFSDLQAGVAAMTGAIWSLRVWSRRNATTYLVTEVFNDDEFDTMRSRQLLRTVRETLAI